jgi:BASS family bile acid:Na+ symporter
MPVSTQALLPLLVMLAMTIVGLELTPADLLRAAHAPARMALALATQVTLLPLLAAAIVLTLDLDPTVAGGLILAAAAAQAPVSNYFCVLARADVPMSVTLTALSSVTATFTMPWVAQAGFALIAGEQHALQVPQLAMMRHIATGLLLPLGAGMLLRHAAPGFVTRNRARLQWVSLALLVALLGPIAVDQASTIAAHLGSLVLSSALFTLAAAALGVAVARTAGWSADQAITMAAALPARSLSMATLVAVGVLGRTQFLSFAFVFFVVQAAMLVPAMLLARARVDAGAAGR